MRPMELHFPLASPVQKPQVHGSGFSEILEQFKYV